MAAPTSQAPAVNATNTHSHSQSQPQPQHANAAFNSNNQSFPQNTPSVDHMAFLTKQNEEKLALAASMINSINAFLAGELIPSTEMTPKVNQVVEEDLDELDVAWNMAMFAFKADKFAKRYGHCPMSASPIFQKNRLRV
ncbi:hypothetical protein Hanom_Chr06g00539061 [Helianthus anomalus]